MKTRGILFGAPMVRALLSGTKTQTRRIYKPRESEPYEIMGELPNGKPWPHWFDPNQGPEYHPVVCKYGEPGDILYVRETFSSFNRAGGRCKPSAAEYILFADGSQMRRDGHITPPLAEYAPDAFDGIKWRPSIYMPRWASRITLEVTDVRVERLQEITEEDARAEGAGNLCGVGNMRVMLEMGQARYEFASIWGTINGEYGPKSWADNPWVWAISFRRIAP